MSEMEYYAGTIKSTRKTLEEFTGFEDPPLGYDSLLEYFKEEYYGLAMLIDDVVFTIDAKEVDAYRMNVVKISNTVYEFNGGFYNGGGDLQEVLTNAVKRANK